MADGIQDTQEEGPMTTMSIEETNAVLTAPGQMFEMEDVEIRGVVTRTWKNCPTSLRVVLDLSRGHGDKDKGAMVRVFEELLGVEYRSRSGSRGAS